ncbi:hypothetical protein FN846DRAFT_981744 [Sphaerosporella brunnea]|uniref:HNH nuclease domain-containing protein n=1 Tax=Sphaerosporella brunnea TaxID=1250544 RepID=A0A5J5EBV2_9PEZI|nr:hypothetical protein FN846DRAFT_981744 [Sphaerosporella brunnea]
MNEDPLPAIHYSPLRGPFADYPAASVAFSEQSGTEAFDTEIEDRDGQRCVICNHGVPGTVDNAHIVPRWDPDRWQELKRHGWIPAGAKSVVHEARNGMRLCQNCHHGFDHHHFCIRFIPQREEYVFVNWACYSEYVPFHGLALRLDPNHRLAPFATLFLWHEGIVRAAHRFDKPLPVPLVKTGCFRPNNLAVGLPEVIIRLPDAKPKSDSDVHDAKPKSDSDVHDAKPKSDSDVHDAKPKSDCDVQDAKPKSDSDVHDAKPAGDSPPHAAAPESDVHGVHRRQTSTPSRAPEFTFADLQAGRCYHDGYDYRPIAELHRPSPTAGSAQLVYLDEIKDVTAFLSEYNMRNLGFKNMDDISQEGGDEPADGVRRWGQTAEESVRLWLDRH